jgi:hypothetical protein
MLSPNFWKQAAGVYSTTNNFIGYDANALYLWSIMQEMPMGHFVRRKSENQFRRETPRRYEWMAIEPVRLLADFCQVAQTGLHCLSGITLRDVAHWNFIPRYVGTHIHAK